MSTATLPTYPDLFTLPQDKLEEVERACRFAKHLSDDEKLLDRILKDKKTLDRYKIDKMDIYRNHRNMFMLFNDDTAEKCSEDEKKIMNIFIDKFMRNDKPASFGECWACQSKQVRKIKMNNCTYLITNIIWGGAEQCPIERRFSPESYFGYERGNVDWFVIKLSDLSDNLLSDVNKSTSALWIPDLLPAQIGMFGFAQSPKDNNLLLSSSIDSGIKGYRLDLKLYIKLFDIRDNVKLLPTISKNSWSFTANFVEIPDETIKLKECNTKDYYAFTYVYNTKIVMVVKFYNDEENIEENIKIFGYKCGCMIQNKNNYSRYELCSYTCLAF